MTPTSQKIDTSFQRLVEQVARKLISVKLAGREAFIQTPLRYPSGSSSVIRISDEGGSFFVSDYGLGFDEAEMMGASQQLYFRQASAIAMKANVQFDQHAFFIVQVDKERLPGAVIAVANCSLEAVQLTAFKLAERKTNDANEKLYTRLANVFKGRRVVVSKNVPIIGASNHEWHVATMVQADGRKTAFEAVGTHPNSYATAVMKFGDIARLNSPPRTVAVVQNKMALGDYIGVLSPVANIVEDSLEDSQFIKLAEAA